MIEIKVSKEEFNKLEESLMPTERFSKPEEPFTTLVFTIENGRKICIKKEI